MMKEPYRTWSKQNTARKRNAGKTLALRGLLESWVRFYSCKQVGWLAWEQQSAFIYVFFIMPLWCWNKIKCGWSLRNTDEIPAQVYVVVREPCLVSWFLSVVTVLTLHITDIAATLTRASLTLIRSVTDEMLIIRVSMLRMLFKPVNFPSLSLSSSCPVVGCGNTDVKEADLIPDQVLRRKIQSQKRQANRT